MGSTYIGLQKTFVFVKYLWKINLLLHVSGLYGKFVQNVLEISLKQLKSCFVSTIHVQNMVPIFSKLSCAAKIGGINFEPLNVSPHEKPSELPFLILMRFRQ